MGFPLGDGGGPGPGRGPEASWSERSAFSELKNGMTQPDLVAIDGNGEGTKASSIDSHQKREAHKPSLDAFSKHSQQFS